MRGPAMTSEPLPEKAPDGRTGVPHFNRAIVAALVLALSTAAGALWWECVRSEAVAFLPERAGADWIVYPKPVEAGIHDAISVTAHFRRSFTLTALPASATLSVCAFKGGAVTINGREVGNIRDTGRGWKLPSSAEVAGLLQPGTNEITAWVTNSFGPPALWMRLQSGRFSLGTDEGWQVSLAGTGWQSAHRARQPLDYKPDSSLYKNTRIADVLKRVWPMEAAFGAASLVLVWGMTFWLRRRPPPGTTLPATTSTKLSYGLLVLVLMARVALLINDLPKLPRSIGFDAADHEQYIQFIQEKHALPLANDGWQMFQPPLYYLASALVLEGCGLSVGDEDAVYFLRAVNGVIGLLWCWVVWLCLRLLFPENLPAQAAGMLVASFLPPALYLSQYVTNELLAGFLVTVAFYFFLRMLRDEKDSLWLPIGVGVALGAAMLAKFSVLLALPCFPLALSRRLVPGNQRMRRDWPRDVAVSAAAGLLVCGWHYARVWARFGKPLVGNWGDTEVWQAWWQEPGFRTSAFYSSFGRALISPLYSGLHSFADGIYSTLWGDGLAGGLIQTPWNYDLMAAGYWVGLGMSVLVMIGGAFVLVKLIGGRSRAEWLLVLGMVFFYGFGLIWNTLQAPYYCSVKAFYGMSALLPFSALAAVGCDWLRQRHRAVATAVWVLLLVWCMTVYASFWVSNGNPATHLLRGIDLARQGHYPEAAQSLSIALRLKPDYAEAHGNLGATLCQEGRLDEAINHLQEAIRLKPDYAEARNNLQTALLIKSRAGGATR